MLLVKGSIYRNVTEREAENFIKQGYTEVKEKPSAKRGAKRGNTESD